MTVSQYKCPLCSADAHASDIDLGNRARLYCPDCSTYDLTKSGFEKLVGSSTAHRHALSQRAKAAPAEKVLVITRDGAAYEVKKSKADRPAPAWLINQPG